MKDQELKEIINVMKKILKELKYLNNADKRRIEQIRITGIR